MGILYVVATPIGNLDDITKRALDVLSSVDIILCEDTRRSLKLLNYYNIKKKLVAYHKFNEKEKVDGIINNLKDGLNIAIITDAGTPCISDPGYILVNKAREEGIDVIGVGGISALVTALSISGLNTDSFSFYGFFPREKKDKDKMINNIINSSVNLVVFYEAPKRIINTLKYLYDNLGNIKVSILKDLTKIHETNYFGFIKDIILDLENFDKTTLGEYTVILEVPKKEKENKSNDDISIEALLVDIIVKKNVSMKEAITILSENSNYSKNDIYNASLNIKKCQVNK